MQSAALAIGYGIWVRNQLGFVICAAALGAMALGYPFLFAYSRSPAVLVASTIPLIGIFSYVLNATIFAQDPGSLASSYPRHLLVMPVKSWSLVFWPMLFGSLILLSLLFVTVKIVYRSSGLDIPLGLPALALVVIVAWIQAIAWFPLSVRWIRAIIAVGLVVGLGSLPITMLVGLDRQAHLMVAALLVAYLAAAYALAFAALRAQRRGDSWQLWYSRERGSGAATRVLSHCPFRSAERAQLWYEWNCHGRGILVFLAFEMLMIWGIVLSGGRPIDVARFPLVLGLLLFAPIAVIGSSGALMGRFRPFWVEYRQIHTFLNVRPIASGKLVAAKLRLALLLVVSGWGFVLIGTTAVVLLSRSLASAITVWHRFEANYPGGRAPLICLLAVMVAPVLMFRLLTDWVPFTLSGRKWLADGTVVCFVTLLVSVISGGVWIGQHLEYLPRVMALAPWVVAVIAALKASVAVVAFRAAIRRKLIDWHQVAKIVAIWAVFTSATVALALLVAPPASIVSKAQLLAGAASFVPLARFPVATLTVDWSRHR